MTPYKLVQIKRVFVKHSISGILAALLTPKVWLIYLPFVCCIILFNIVALLNVQATQTNAPDQPLAPLTSAVEVLSEGNNYFLKVDLQDSRVHIRVGLANNDSGGYETLDSMKNRYAGRGHAEWAIINGDYFGGGCPSNVNCAQGLTYIDGNRKDNWSAYGTTWPVRGSIGFDSSNHVEGAIGDAQTKRHMVIAGGPWIVRDGGNPTCNAQFINGTTYFSTGEQFNGDVRYWCTDSRALTAAGFSADRRYLLLGVSRGGISILQLSQWLKDRGAHSVLKLDSGGSSGMYHSGTPVLANGSRAVVNHLAVIIDNSSPPSDSCTSAEGVVLYEHPGFGGRCTRFTGDDNNLGDNPIGNDAASSVRVIGNYQAIVFEHGDYNGANSPFTGDDPDFGNDTIGHDRASSIRVSRRDTNNCNGVDGVYLYEHANHQGRCSKFTGDSPNPRAWDVGNDAASSIHIIGNYEAVVYQNDDYNGNSSTFTGDDLDFGNDTIGHDQASSIRVRQRTGGASNCDGGGEGVYLYEHPNHSGRCTKFTSDAPNPRDWYVGNDAASSVRIVGNYETTVYEHDAYNGISSPFSSDDLDFGNDTIGHDRVSSLRVRQRASGPTSCADGEFLAEYFANRDLSGSPLYRRCEGSVNADWGYNGPGSGIGNDNFSLRWTGRFWFEEGSYRFTARTDDGVRFWVDDQSLLDEWRDMGATEFARERNLSAGMHTLRLEYYENSGYTTARLSWQRQQTTTDPDDGRTIGYDQGLDGTVNPANDRDDYYFEGSANQAITLRMDKRDSTLDSYIELYNPDGTILGRDDDSGGNQNSRLAITLRQNGRHKIIARDYSSATGGYRISLSRESTVDPDDNRWIAQGGTLQGTINPNDDRDTYYVAGVSGRIVNIRMNKIDSGLDSYLEFYNPAGVKLAENDDGGGDANSWIAFTLPADGTYRIVARSYNLASSGRYNLVLSAVSNENLARSRPAWATSTEFSGVEPYKAFDGNLSTRWSSRYQDPQLIYVDLGSVKTFNQVMLRWETAYARQYGIYYWTGSAWRQVYGTNNGDGGNDTITFTPVQAQFVGMNGTQRGTQYGYSLWEFEVYNNTNVPLPIVPPDPDNKPGETNVTPLTPLSPNDEGKATILIGEGADGQENMPLAETVAEAPTTGVQAGLPTAHIFYPNAETLTTTQELILFQGAATDNDEDGQAIVEYRWLSDLDGQIGATDTFTLPYNTLSPGNHTITFQARDNEGDWSQPITVTVSIEGQDVDRKVYLPIISSTP